MPYSTCESLASFVVQLIAAPDVVIDPTATAETTGGVVSGGGATVTVTAAAVPMLPAASRAVAVSV